MSTPLSDDALIDEAAHWMALLQSGQVSVAEHQAFLQWRNADPRRAEMVKAMEGGLVGIDHDTLSRLPRDSLLHALAAPSGRRRFLRTALSVAGAVSMAGLVARFTDVWPEPGLLQTGTAQRRNLTLADGSTAILDARSRLVQRFDHDQRLLRLTDGKAWLDIAKDPGRPFIVETAQGRIRALGTRFVVEQGDGQTHVSMLHSQVQVRTRGGDTQIISAGEHARFDAEHIVDVQALTGAESAWTQGQLEVHDQALGTVIDALRDYRPGIIRLSPEVKDLRLSGIFPLDDSDRALQLLARSLPVSVRRRGPYWVEIDVRR